MHPNDLEIAIEHHQAGRLAQAEPIYRQFLALQPQHDGVLHLLGVLYLQSQRYDVAVDLIRQAIGVQPNVPNYFRHLGAALYALRRLDEAIVAFRRIVILAPNDADGHFQLGALMNEVGRRDEAVACYRRTLALKPDHLEAHNNLGTVLQTQGHLVNAIAHFQKAVSLNPNFAAAYGNLGIALRASARFDEAIASYQRALALNPNLTIVHVHLGAAYFERGQFESAIESYRRATALEPNNVDAHRNLGDALLNAGRAVDAIDSYKQALALGADDALVHNNLGVALAKQGRKQDAINCFQHALTLDPALTDSLSNLGNALIDTNRAREAVAFFERALAADADRPETLRDLGAAYFRLADVDHAIDAFERALRLRPDFAQVHFNLGMALLLRGEFPRGWAEYEWRWRCAGFETARGRFAQPPWDGSTLAGRTLLLDSETQGFGDTMQFVRYLETVERAGGKIVAACQPQLKRLLQTSFPNREWHSIDQPLPFFDVHCTMISLPYLLGTTLERIPRNCPYLRADVDETRKWRHRLADDASTCKVGLVWAGNKTHGDDFNRSLRLATLAPLANVPGVCFYSLQVGETGRQAIDPPAGMRLIDWTSELHDYAETAALIANLDLVVSVDTSVAHLAGAMGKPTWTLLPFAAEWRWLLDRDDSPWYPTMRLFRQPQFGDWGAVVEKVAGSLRELAASSPTR